MYTVIPYARQKSLRKNDAMYRSVHKSTRASLQLPRRGGGGGGQLKAGYLRFPFFSCLSMTVIPDIHFRVCFCLSKTLSLMCALWLKLKTRIIKQNDRFEGLTLPGPRGLETSSGLGRRGGPCGPRWGGTAPLWRTWPLQRSQQRLSLTFKKEEDEKKKRKKRKNKHPNAEGNSVGRSSSTT